MSTIIMDSCANCGEEAKCRRRDFSEKAWNVLLIWSEVQPDTVDQAICDSCYNELREVLIDRADEIDSTLIDRPAAISAHQGNEAGKTRKAG